MNQTNIPPVNQANRPLVSVGNGNQVKWGDFPVVQQTIPTTTGGSTLPTGTGTGQMIWWNGTAWVVTSTPASGKYFYWNGTAWVGGTAGDATKIQGYPVNITGIGNGDVLYWSNVGSTQQWLTGPTPTGDGQLQYWNTSLSGHWSLSAAATSTGQALVWNNSTLTWGPANITLAGDVTGSAGANTVVKVQNYPVNMTGVANGDVLYWSNVGSVQQWVTGPTPTTNGQTLIWNSSTTSWNVGTPTASGTAGNDLSGTYPNPTVIRLQNYPVNVTGLSGSGGFMYYTSTGSQFVFSGSPTGAGSIMYWNGSGYVSTAPSSTGVLQWNSGSSTYSYVSVGGSTPNNDAWSANPQTSGVTVGTSPATINSVSFNTGSFVYSKFLVTFSMAQTGAVSASATLTVNIIEGSGSALVANYAVGQALTTSRNTYSGSVVYVPLSTVSTPSTMTLQCNWNTGSGLINYSTLSVVGIS